MEKALQQKQIALVANSTVSLTWAGADFQRAFPESIIRKQIALRLTCFSTSVQNGVFVGVSYTTLTKTYQLAERLTIGTIPAGGSVELTAASIPALGRLFENIISITVTLTAPVTGTVTVIPIIDDEPPPLAADLGERIGLDAGIVENAIIIANNGTGNITSGSLGVTNTWYTVPAGKRFYIDTIFVAIGPTASFPADMTVSVIVRINGVDTTIALHSNSETVSETFIPPVSTALIGGDRIQTFIDNVSGSTVTYWFSLIGREVF